ncbi:hypothetical protein AVEN_81969-1 [Araneus ventricosus]|uniref:RNase H type-1 domain-containing protein n=1 Tax=Araneus ventricosus TaxID=182803 RepID=A0A4Y2P2H8_ARAVE|nr:hypothetical protein AVEN_81969-1 [Araneus ventricosus]
MDTRFLQKKVVVSTFIENGACILILLSKFQTPIFPSLKRSCGVVIADVPSSFQLNALCSVLTTELTEIFLALERISDLLEHKFCIYSDSKSALEALSHPQNGTHPLALDILCLLQSLQARDFQILFCWLPGHVGIQGNELADAAAKTATTSWQQPLSYADIKKFISHHVHN